MNYNINCLDQVYNDNTLNIFCDASMRRVSGVRQDGCYAVVAICKDTIIDSEIRVTSETTSNGAEVRGLRAALSIANRYKNVFPFINIFCDSKISLIGLRDNFPAWCGRCDNQGVIYNSKGKPVANQSIFIECHGIMQQITPFTVLHLLHQAGHVSNGMSSIRTAIDVYKESNNVWGKIDYNLIRYISQYNNMVDNMSRSHLRRTDILRNTWYDPIEFSFMMN